MSRAAREKATNKQGALGVVQIVRDAALVANVLEHMRQVPADTAGIAQRVCINNQPEAGPRQRAARLRATCLPWQKVSRVGFGGAQLAVPEPEPQEQNVHAVVPAIRCTNAQPNRHQRDSWAGAGQVHASATVEKRTSRR